MQISKQNILMTFTLCFYNYNIYLHFPSIGHPEQLLQQDLPAFTSLAFL